MVKIRNKKRHKLSRKILIIIFIILMSLLVLTSLHLLTEGGVIKYKPKIEDRNFSIEDKCSIIVGKIVHPIDREDECINKCIAQCETYSLTYDKTEFELKNNSCNACGCFCK